MQENFLHEAEREGLHHGMIIDASAFLALILSEEEGLCIEKTVVPVLERNGQIFVPALFWYEVMNGLITAVRRKRIKEEDLRSIEMEAQKLPVSTDPIPSAVIRQRTREYALQHDLTFNDAAYLELALRNRMPLLTVDPDFAGLFEMYPTLSP